MRKSIIISLLAAILSACSTKESTPQFTIEGQVSGAEGKMLTFENAASTGTIILDSVRISQDGSFTLKGSRPEAPEFYRLRLEGKTINICVDSTETVKVEASLGNFDTDYKVDGVNNQKIKELTLMHSALSKQISSLKEQYTSGKIMTAVYEMRANQLVEEYKNQVRSGYILSAPNTPYAYFALFQTIDGYLLFDPQENKDDIKCFAAVATSYDNLYPGTARAVNLKNIAIRGLKNTRNSTAANTGNQEMQVNTTGMIDIVLQDIDGKTRKVSDLRGKVVLIDFALYSAEGFSSHNLELRNLYSQYQQKGLEIYQISLDANEHYWKTTADKLPWICVRDPQSQYSTLVKTFAVESIPAMFIVDKDNDIVGRADSLDGLEAAIKKYL